MITKYRNRNIKPDATLLEALKKMDALGKKLLIIEDEDVFVGLLSIGDIQRAIIQNIALDTPLNKVLRKDIRVAHPDESFESVKQMMLDFRMELCPLIDNDNRVADIYYWEDIFLGQKPVSTRQFNLPVVVMAGGEGSRLRPLTNVLPKPLIPIGEKTMLEEIFDRFVSYGCNSFFISVNYKAELIKYYIKNQNLPYAVEFFEESKPMGTAGSLSLLKGKIDQTFFVTNCDILIDQDYSEILDFHYKQKNEITVLVAVKHYPIPYGTIRTGDNGHIIELNEKPVITLKINSGMYILEPHLLDEIPSNEVFHMTQIIDKILGRKGKAGAFPVSEKSMKDIGDWHEYVSNILSK